MPIDGDFNYTDKLTLEHAKLANRIRLNFLGSQEMILDYHKITGAIREDSVEWLEANRLTLVDPEFSYKTYEGTWTCVSITYNEDRAVIRQTFKIDSQVGNLGDVDEEPIFGSQSGTSSRISKGMEIERAYYWRISDPTTIELPPAGVEGEIWTKTQNDNGDGTYDVIVSKEVEQELTAESAIQAGPSRFQDFPGGFTEDIVVSTNNTEQSFSSVGGSISDAAVGQMKTINNVPLENGKFRTTVTTRTATPQRIPPLSEAGGPNYPWLEYGSDYITDANNIIIGKNQTWDDFIADRDRTNLSPAIFKINSISVHPNQFGLFDYTIISNTPG